MHEWFNLRRSIRLEIATQEGKTHTYWGITTRISEVGVDISLTQTGIGQLILGQTITANLSILEEGINLSGQITTANMQGDFYHVHIDFDCLNLEQERKLIALLFCRPGQWKRRNSPGELYSVWLMFRILLRPKVLFDRNPKINGIDVAQI